MKKITTQFKIYPMKKLVPIISLLLFMFTADSCRKKIIVQNPPDTAENGAETTKEINESFKSTREFLSKFRLPAETFTIDGIAGGSFTTSRGTKVIIPAGAFVRESGEGYFKKVTIEFRDIFKKSEMLLADMPTITTDGKPLVSGGEFFIRAAGEDSVRTFPLMLKQGEKIEVQLPVEETGGVFDGKQEAFVVPDFDPIIEWEPLPMDPIRTNADMTIYVFDLYKYGVPADKGTWCNSDNRDYFQNYDATGITMVATDETYEQEVFLIFGKINCMLHIYGDAQVGLFDRKINYFHYDNAPMGLQYTMVALGVKNNKLQAAFVPRTIGDNEEFHFELKPMSSEDFLKQLKALD
jgi:hypothetical protein